MSGRTQRLPQIMVAPNGARLTQADHPAVPVTVDEIVACATACQTAGAGGLHFHLRDADQAHLLDAVGYREVLDQLTQACPDMLLQITSEAAGRYDPDVQREVVLKSQPTHASVALRELMREPDEVAGFYREAAAAGITVQHILYNLADAELLKSVLPEEAFRDPELQLLFVLGRYVTDQASEPAMLDPFLDWMAREGITPDWACCAFGQSETDCLIYAASHGGKCRIGFENNRLHRDGTLAKDNAERVRALAETLELAPAG